MHKLMYFAASFTNFLNSCGGETIFRGGNAPIKTLNNVSARCSLQILLSSYAVCSGCAVCLCCLSTVYVCLKLSSQVSFEKRVSVGGGDGEDGEGEKEEEVVKVVKKTLFQRSNSYPQKKVLTFNRYSDDFPFSVYYSHMGFLSKEEKTYVHTCICKNLFHFQYSTNL